MNIKDIRNLERGKKYIIRVKPGSFVTFGTVGEVKPNMDHTYWGTIYDIDGKYLASASYCEWFEIEEYEGRK